MLKGPKEDHLLDPFNKLGSHLLLLFDLQNKLCTFKSLQSRLCPLKPFLQVSMFQVLLPISLYNNLFLYKILMWFEVADPCLHASCEHFVKIKLLSLEMLSFLLLAKRANLSESEESMLFVDFFLNLMCFLLNQLFLCLLLPWVFN